MDLVIERMDVWAASVKDEPGGLAQVLTGLREAGADLEFIIARRSTKTPNTGVVFVTPLRGDKELAAAADLGFNVTSSIHAVRIEGENKPGVAAELTEKLAVAGLNLRGLSAAVISARFILYIGFDTSEDVARAMSILQSA
ncbi:MAG: ACT domain-containing protein [Planctomycetes bacterium]|nr:ACT domain-containing protein [Planctomycetota bacterium]